MTKQGKLTGGSNYKTAAMGVEISAGDLLKMCKLKNTDTHLIYIINQPNIPSAAQISAVANKTLFFWVLGLNNGANNRNLMSANVSKFVLILSHKFYSHKFCIWKENSYKCIFNKVRSKMNCVRDFSVLILHCVSLIYPNSMIFTPKDGLRWCKLLLNLTPKMVLWDIS